MGGAEFAGDDDVTGAWLGLTAAGVIAYNIRRGALSEALSVFGITLGFGAVMGAALLEDAVVFGMSFEDFDIVHCVEASAIFLCGLHLRFWGAKARQNLEIKRKN